jgi:hypothetical protein
MAKSKGKFITMAFELLELRPEAKREASERIRQLTGEDVSQLAPEGWYDTSVIDSIFKITEKHYGTLMAWSTIKVMGRRVFPTIAKTVGFPEHLQTPLDWLKWEGQTFLNDHQGIDVVPRKFLTTDPGHIVVEALSPGYTCILVEGVYEGILDMCGIRQHKVRQTRCVKKGDPVCEYDITWSEG